MRGNVAGFYGLAVVAALLIVDRCTRGLRQYAAAANRPGKGSLAADPQSQIEGLKNSDVRIRGISAFNLGNMGAKAADAIPVLEKLAKDDANPKVRENARLALEKIRAAAGSSGE